MVRQNPAGTPGARPRGRTVCTAAACAIASCAIALLAPGCGSSASTAAATAALNITERDFHISLSTTHVSPGDVLLRVHNQGPDEHELIVVPMARVARGALPMRADGFTVDEEAIQHREPGSLDPGQPGSVRDLRVRLTAGTYLLFCNMEGHFMSGMSTRLVVQ